MLFLRGEEMRLAGDGVFLRAERGKVAFVRWDSFVIRMENKRVVTTPPHGKQKGRYDPKTECHKMLVKTDKLYCFG